MEENLISLEDLAKAEQGDALVFDAKEKIWITAKAYRAKYYPEEAQDGK